MVTFKNRMVGFVIIVLCLTCCVSWADVTMPAVFSDNMVLQQKSEVAIWGWAEPGEKVTVKGSWKWLRGKTARADKDGKWSLKIRTPRAGGPHELIIKGDNTITLDNVMTGEVWLCSGQSNMWLPLSGLKPHEPVEGSEEEIKNADYPMIRLFTVKLAVATDPADDCDGTWQECSPETAKGFTAVGYFFGKQLHKELNVPIGLIHSSWGGTPAEAWTRREILDGDPELKVLVDNAEREQLEWKKKVDKLKAEGEPIPQRPWSLLPQLAPSHLYNAMINPLIPYDIKGVIWYQGESNAASAYLYRKLFPAMIENWRSDWGLGDFSFYFVQLASYVKHQPGVPLEAKKGEPAEDAWAELREAQLMTLEGVSHTGMAVAIDIGEANNIHPAKKKEVGQRLALWALAKDYGKEIAYSGPIYRSMGIEGDRIRINFDYAESGLDAKGDTLDGFAIAGADKKFVWANAKIDGQTVVVWSDQVKEPVAVRYAWAIYPFCNLYNEAGLPASPFRTDD